jgi:dolichol-phosphate mannosyltransferase
LVPLAVFVAFSLRHDVKLDWTGPLWLAAVPAMAAWIAGGKPAGAVAAWVRAAWLPTGVTILLLLGTALHYLALGLPGVGYSAHMELVPVGWRQLGRSINDLTAEVQHERAGAPLVVGMDRYALASEIAFYSRDHAASVRQTASVHLFGEMGLMYERWFPIEAQRKRTLLLVAWNAEDLRDERLKPHVTSLQPLKSLDLMRQGKLVRSVYYRIAYGYRPTMSTDSDATAQTLSLPAPVR